MENFTFYSPTKFVFGKETELQAGSLVRSFGGHKVLLHYGGGRNRSFPSVPHIGRYAFHVRRTRGKRRVYSRAG